MYERKREREREGEIEHYMQERDILYLEFDFRDTLRRVMILLRLVILRSIDADYRLVEKKKLAYV